MGIEPIANDAKNGDEPSSGSPSPHLPISPSFFSRWWTYQSERFPILAHGVLIAAFSSSAVCFSSLLRDQATPPALFTLVVAFGTAFLFFLQLRIADEFKDFEEDSRYRPYRAVPRGLVSLRELGVLGVAAALVQLLLCLALDPSLFWLLACAWTYLALMSKEFFVGEWLKKRPVPYLISHMVIVPIIDFYATACDWWPLGNGAPTGLVWFVAASYSNGVVIEIGRKVRAPADEEVGVNTYSALWGPGGAVLAWLAALLTTAACALLAAMRIDFLMPTAVVLTVLLLAAATLAWRFLAAPTKKRSKLIETLSGVWMLVLYLNIGAIPLLWRWWWSAD
jgi:4-hydroxybenzoate polyprenyltransferase